VFRGCLNIIIQENKEHTIFLESLDYKIQIDEIHFYTPKHGENSFQIIESENTMYIFEKKKDVEEGHLVKKKVIVNSFCNFMILKKNILGSLKLFAPQRHGPTLNCVVKWKMHVKWSEYQISISMK